VGKRRFLTFIAIAALLAVGVPATRATADPTALTLVAERYGTTNDIREQGVAGADLHVSTGTATSGDTSVPMIAFGSTVNGLDLQTVDVSAGLAAGTYATSRIPGGAAALLDPGSLGACGNSEPGSLTVLEAQYAEDGTPTVFAASFDIESCGGGQPTLHGEIRWNSTHSAR